jgi:hypothetical protein
MSVLSLQLCSCVCLWACVCVFVRPLSPAGDLGEELGFAAETEVFGDGMSLCQDQ